MACPQNMRYRWPDLELRAPEPFAHIEPMPEMVNSPSAPDNDAPGPELEALRKPLIGFFSRRLRSTDEVADLVQEVFLRLAARSQNSEIGDLKSYAFKVAASVLVDRSRRHAVRHQSAHVQIEGEEGIELEITTDRIVEARDTLSNVRRALEELPQRTQTIFVLRRIEGLRYREIAERVGLSVSSVEKHMVRAIEHISGLEDFR